MSGPLRAVRRLAELPELVTMNRMCRNGNFELVTISMDPPDRKAQALADLQEEHVATRNYGPRQQGTRTPWPTPWTSIGPEDFLTRYWSRPAGKFFNAKWAEWTQ